MNKTNTNKYLAYISSDEWRDKANERYKIDNYKCVVCGCIGTSYNPLECHHLHYHTLYEENVYKDLVTLCKSCHRQVHAMLCRVVDEDGTRGWGDTLKCSNHVTKETLIAAIKEQLKEN